MRLLVLSSYMFICLSFCFKLCVSIAFDLVPYYAQLCLYVVFVAVFLLNRNRCVMRCYVCMLLLSLLYLSFVFKTFINNHVQISKLSSFQLVKLSNFQTFLICISKLQAFKLSSCQSLKLTVIESVRSPRSTRSSTSSEPGRAVRARAHSPARASTAVARAPVHPSTGRRLQCGDCQRTCRRSSSGTG